MKIVCFSTGNMYVKGKKDDVNRAITKCRHLKIDGIEFCMGKVMKIEIPKISKKNLKFLRGLQYNTIHVPFKENGEKFFVGRDKKSKDKIKKLIRIAKIINAKSILFHPNQVSDFNILNKYDFKFNMENMPCKYNLSVSFYLNILKQNPKLGFVLDAAHALDTKGELESLLKKVKRIDYVHLSGNVDHSHHIPLNKLNRKYLNKLKRIKKLNCPIVIETWTGKNNISLFKKEVRFVRKWLNS